MISDLKSSISLTITSSIRNKSGNTLDYSSRYVMKTGFQFGAGFFCAEKGQNIDSLWGIMWGVDDNS